ncbi:MAG: hypothetical protein ACE1ZD_00215 [Dehalococcoidia bacterium]
MNRKDLIRMVDQELSGDRALESATHITDFYRSPGASGYHRATDFVADLFRTNGLDKVWVERYPLDGETKFVTQSMPLAWDPISAELRVGSPQGSLLVSYEKSPSCLPWWTPSTPEGGVTLELVDVGTGERPEDYQKQDVKGKVVLIRSTERASGWGHAATLAMEHGVAGIITDYLLYQTAPFRTRESLPDPVMLLRMPSIHNSAWAIVVNYPAAEQLASLAAQGGAKVWADIQAKTFKGEGQNLLADITGTDKSDEYIQFVCHTTTGTKPGANCASGPALLAEMGRTMSTLISSGRIPRPKRTIRFLVNVEGQGTKNYVHNHGREIEKTIVVMALDSVGHDQRKCKSALLFYHSPDSLPTFVNDFYVSLMEATPKETRWVFHNDDTIPFVNFIDHPYTPWSDNKYYPAFGIPSPLLMSWPDLYFHTDYLTADNLDPMVFRRCGITTAVAALELANAGPVEAQDIMREVGSRSQFRLSRVALEGKGSSDEPRVRRRLTHLAKRDQAAVESAMVLVNSEERKQHSELESTKSTIQKEIGARLEEVTGWLKNGASQPQEFPAGKVVPKRLVQRDAPGLAGTGYWDLYNMAEEMEARDPKMRYDSLRIIGDEMWNFVNGRRNVNQIAEAIGAEFDFDLEPRHVLKLFEGLASKGFVGFDAPGG